MTEPMVQYITDRIKELEQMHITLDGVAARLQEVAKVDPPKSNPQLPT